MTLSSCQPSSAWGPTPGLTPEKLQEAHTETSGKAPIKPEEDRTMKLTIVYDNNAFDPRLKTAWGFSALVEYDDHTLLFDTGGDAPMLLENMDILEIDPAQIEKVIISHDHGDHTGGLEGLLEQNPHPTVYVIPSYSAGSRRRISQTTTIVDVTVGQQLDEGVFTTGEMKGDVPEQALLIKTGQGLVVITGCAHPGVVRMIEKAQEILDEPIHLVVGGFHLGQTNAQELDSIMAAFRQMGVEKVAPTHCTGDHAIELFEAEYKDDFIQAGAGKVIVVDP
jgi:7,8-dihydropterin-6-yl-methyl-4-(beta-D-ribofuranosyl)aminobenzene 5'-phosphate synthase